MTRRARHIHAGGLECLFQPPAFSHGAREALGAGGDGMQPAEPDQRTVVLELRGDA